MASGYSVQLETAKLLKEGLVENPLLSHLPPDVAQNAALVTFTGSPTPSIPINWRFAESISALKGLESAFINALLTRKYGQKPVQVEINTDHASLFVMSTLLVDWVDASGKPATKGSVFERISSVFPDVKDYHRAQTTLHRSAATNIYKTKDDRYYHIHGSLNPDPTIGALGLPSDRDTSSYEDACEPFVEKVAQIDSASLDTLMNDGARQAGTICWTAEEFAASEHGKANAHIGLYDLKQVPNPQQPPCWWPSSPETSTKRPLAGLKVVDLTRIIAGPSITRGLAELGASVMRITAPHIADATPLHIDLNWGKWNAELDLRKEDDRQKLISLVKDADVFVDGYRPGVLGKYGFGKDDIIEMCSQRSRGIVYLRENTYGWQGPWTGRIGWQQISDACCGVSMEFGRAMGNEEAVTPVFPNSDYCTGVAGVCGVLHALLSRAEKGGSYTVDAALNYYSQWLVRSCGVYPPTVWNDVWSHHGKPVFRHYHNMFYMLPRTLQLLFKNSAATLFRPSFFEIRESKAAGKLFKTIRPVLTFPGQEVKLGFNIGTRTNGVDLPFWPEDLMTEVVAEAGPKI